jgi:multidrug efflux system membrane fusion protein
MSISTETREPLPEVPAPGHQQQLPPRKKAKLRGLIWALLLLIIVGVTGYAVWQAGHPAPVTKGGKGGGGGGGGGGGRGGIGPVPVVVTKVTRSGIPVVFPGLGNVSPYYTVTVKSRVDGQLMKVLFNEGDLVQEGQILCEIDPRPYQVQLDMASATQLHDQALLANANVDLERYKTLVKTDAIPSQQLDTQVALVNQLDATIKQDQANIDSAKLNLTYSKVPAPITGVVGLRLVDPGNIVHASDSNGMITITQLQPIAVLFTIPEDDLPQVTQKLRAGVKLPAEAYNRDHTKKLASGTLITLDNQIDSTTGTSKLKAVFDNKDNSLFPQQFVNIDLLVDTLGNQLVVPNVAVQNGQQGTFVYVVDDDSRVHLRPVQVGITTATSADIISGIKDGERVVIDGTDRLVENAVVRVRKPGEMDNPPGYDPGAGGRGGKKGGKKGGGGDDTKGGDATGQKGAGAAGQAPADGSGDGAPKKGRGGRKKGGNEQ